MKRLGIVKADLEADREELLHHQEDLVAHAVEVTAEGMAAVDRYSAHMLEKSEDAGEGETAAVVDEHRKALQSEKVSGVCGHVRCRGSLVLTPTHIPRYIGGRAPCVRERVSSNAHSHHSHWRTLEQGTLEHELDVLEFVTELLISHLDVRQEEGQQN